MITTSQVDLLEKLMGQLENIHIELSALSKKSPNDAVNPFKLKFVNLALLECNGLLGSEGKPFPDFELFDPDAVPSNSDVTFIVSQYLSALEKFRSDNVKVSSGVWVYDVDEHGVSIRTAMPAKLKR